MFYKSSVVYCYVLISSRFKHRFILSLFSPEGVLDLDYKNWVMNIRCLRVDTLVESIRWYFVFLSVKTGDYSSAPLYCTQLTENIITQYHWWPGGKAQESPSLVSLILIWVSLLDDPSKSIIKALVHYKTFQIVEQMIIEHLLESFWGLRGWALCHCSSQWWHGEPKLITKVRCTETR